jgi:hypothetical protein
MPRRVAVALLWVAAGAGAQPLEDAELLLERVRARARENLARLPDYVCVQTVERTYRSRPEGPFEPLDTLRLEVALVGDRELVAWTGASRFEEKDITELVERGTIGNGAFGLHARNIFLTEAPEFAFAGEERIGELRTLRFDFEVPLERSTYRMRVPPRVARVGYHGSFWVEAETLDLLRLRVVVDDIPEELGLVEASGEIRYGRVRVGEGEFLLPEASELLMTSTTGETSRNLTRFGNCRRYSARSSLSFAEAETPAGAGPRHLALPPKAVIELELETEIDPRGAALGDEVRAVVVRAVKEGNRVLVPAGAVALGRLVRLDRVERPIEHYLIGLEFHTLEAGDLKTGLRATMRRAGPASGLLPQARRLDPTFDRRRKRPFLEILVNEQRRGQGILHWRAQYPVVSRGLRMEWEIEP